MTNRKMEQPRNAIVFTISIIAVTLVLLSNIYGENLRRSNSDTAKHQKILIILTQTRSGSSFTGEIFAASNNSMYLYEPLYPFGDQCGFQDEGKEALLKNFLSCDFTNLKNLYSYGFNVSKRPDSCHCMKNGFCFADASTGLLNSYAQICNNRTQKFDWKSKTCGYPLRPEIISKLCESKNLIITKLTRICTMEELEKVYRHLEASQKRQLYVLHLVRDLRSIQSSIMKLKKRAQNNGSTVYVKGFCKRQRHNVEYVEKHFKESTITGDGRYIRVRYEDFVKNPDRKAEEVFRFMGRSLPPEVVSNIHNYLHPDSSVLQQIGKHRKSTPAQTVRLLQQYANPYGVVRDPSKIQDEWRRIVPFEIVRKIQEDCGDVLEKNGYVIFQSEVHMKDLSLPSFHDVD